MQWTESSDTRVVEMSTSARSCERRDKNVLSVPVERGNVPGLSGKRGELRACFPPPHLHFRRISSLLVAAPWSCKALTPRSL
jgi:hypothetical protein